MKKLFLIRHAEAEAIAPGGNDFMRALTPAGRHSASELASALAEIEKNPAALLVTSTALRAKETSEFIAGNFHINWREEKRLYNCTLETLLEIIAATDNHFEVLLITGHNPSLTESAIYFSGDPAIRLNPAGCVILKFNVNNWADAARENIDGWNQL